MERNINGISYNLEYKKVKNINLRIKSDGTVHVSSNRFMSAKAIDEFVYSKKDFINKALINFSKKQNLERKKYFNETEIQSIITDICRNIFPYYEKLGIKYPQIKFRNMVSQWGNCYPKKNILTFNTNLMYAPMECIEYVVYHEFTHFIRANHSKEFYNELSKVCPEWKKLRTKLKEMSIR